MRFDRPPYWFWRFDRWNLLGAVFLGALAFLLAVRIGAAPQGVVPVLSAPAPGAQLTEGALGEVAGKAAPGTTVRFFDGDTLLGETTADSQGNFRFGLPALGPGQHSLTAVAFDRNGRRLAASAPLAFTVVPAVKPSDILPTFTFGDTQAALAAGKPAIAQGTAAPAARVQLFDGDTLLGETIADASGNWTLGVPALSAGAHRLIVKASGADGTSVSSAPLLVNVVPEVIVPVIQPPAAPLALVEGEPGPTLSGTAAPGAKVQLYDGDRLVGEATAGPDGRWELPLPGLSAGEHRLVARVAGPDGSSVESEPLAVRVASKVTAVRPIIAAPSAPLVEGEPGPALSGTAAPGAKVQLYDGDTLLGEAVAGPDGRWELPLPGLSAGEHRLVARVTGPDGSSVESEPLAAVVGPKVTSVQPVIQPPAAPLALVEGEPGPALSGTAAPGAKVQLYGGDTLLGEAVAGPDGRWELPLPGLSAGEHRLVARVTGPDGSSVESEPLVAVVEPKVTSVQPVIQPPAAPLALVEGEPGPTLSGTAAPGAKVQLYDGDTLLGEAVAGPDGRWEIALPGLSAGEHRLVARVTGPDGSSVESEPLALVVGPAGYPPPYLLTLGPNETAEIPAVGFCLNYGLPFPGATLQPVAAEPLAEPVRKGLAYAAAKGYTESDPWQTQLAVWYLAQGRRLPGTRYTVADEIIRFAQSEAPAPEQGLPTETLLDGVRGGTLEVTLQDFSTDQPLSTAYTGRGTLLVKNLSDQTRQVLVSHGIRFADSTAPGTQAMAVFPVRR